MSEFGLLKTFARELVSLETSARVPEPDLVMEDPEKVAAFTRAGREDGVMAPVYLYHCAQICSVIRPNETVVDLGCGPATQLAMVARLNPETNFIGIDLSDEMLDRARAHCKEQGLKNVTFQKGDITALSDLPDASCDAVMSTVVLHQLPNLRAFHKCLEAARRILKPGGGLYMVDFGHLKSERSIDYFAYQYADRQPELFTIDYLNSLRAAFHLSDWQKAAAVHFAKDATLYSTMVMPFMVALKSRVRRPLTGDVASSLLAMRKEMPVWHQKDFRDLAFFFRFGGLKCPMPWRSILRISSPEAGSVHHQALKGCRTERDCTRERPRPIRPGKTTASVEHPSSASKVCPMAWAFSAVRRSDQRC
ncbi:hypothetical protein JCM17844_00690 [Iodidimonas gelatinilytica]|uniref:Arsenite methyltransferase n=1 Tax=Iodidimonas gelatinilytica TaxID=1236966 RepID=A0A5A7MK90_9PROT|nr:class I SAM-dependent methyltransferase [Iodidimonas gelatinilytica]GEQ96432.1 hypothetical protein JCM17844_00690 [Iodidimonas gelatinilytica]